MHDKVDNLGDRLPFLLEIREFKFLEKDTKIWYKRSNRTSSGSNRRENFCVTFCSYLNEDQLNNSIRH